MTQTTLNLYQELQEIGYTDSHKNAILKLLGDMEAHSTDSVLMAGGKQYNARILELRGDGWDIESIREGKNKFFFKLNGGEKMVDTQEAMESQFVTADLVKSSKTNRLVVVDPGKYEETDFGRRLTLKVNIDGREKIWRPNRETVENLQVLGKDSMDWLSKAIVVTVEKRSGKECIIGRPEGQPEEKPIERPLAA